MWFETVVDQAAGAGRLQARRYGAIETAQGRLVRVRLRPYPKLASLAGAVVLGRWRHATSGGDRCLLFYNQPRAHPGFLAVVYLWTARNTSLATVQAALAVLESIARLKRSQALLCDAANTRLSDRVLARYGWQPHCPSNWHRNFIKRF